MTVRETALAEVLLITPRVFHDDRGLFFEAFKPDAYEAAGITCGFVQDNVSYSKAGVIRGMHYQLPKPQAKLIQVLAGAVMDYALDVRHGSPTFGQWVGELLSDENHAQLFIPAGFAHGFAVVGDRAIVSYKCSTLFEPNGDTTILWNDPQIGIDWPTAEPILSAKDAVGMPLADIRVGRLPQFGSV